MFLLETLFIFLSFGLGFSKEPDCLPRSTSIDCLFTDSGEHGQEIDILGQLYKLSSAKKITPSSFKIFGLIENLQSIQPKIKILQRTESKLNANIKEYRSLCNKFTSNAKIKVYDDGKQGVLASNDIEPFEEIFNIDANDTINVAYYRLRLEKVAGLKELLRAPIPQRRFLWDRNPWLALGLMIESVKSTSRSKTFLQTLPTTFNTFTFFDKQQFEAYKGSQGYKGAILGYMYMAQQYAKLKAFLIRNPKLLQSFKIRPDIFTFDFYRWAWTVTQIYGFQDKKSHIITQCASSIEARQSPNAAVKVQSEGFVKYFHRKLNKFIVFSNRKVKAGDEIYVDHRNEDVFTIADFSNTFGYVNNGAPVGITVRLDPTDKDYVNKKKLIKKLKLGSESSCPITLTQNYFTLIDDNDFPCLMINSLGILPEKTDIPSPKNWKIMFEFLHDQIDQKIAAYKFSTSQVSERLQDSKINPKLELVLKTILAELNFLNAAQTQCIELINHPQSIDWSLARTKWEFINENGWFSEDLQNARYPDRVVNVKTKSSTEL